MKNFFIVANPYKDKDGYYSNKISQYIKEKGGKCDIYLYDEQDDSSNFTNPENVPEGVECIIVIGGDGTLIQAANNLKSLDLPYLGVNKGTLGYLMDTDFETVFNSIDKLFNEDYSISERMMLDGKIYRKDQLIFQETALNDIVINRSGILSIIEFDVYVNDKYLTTYHADGVILATATGSTAYSLSAGGPIIKPNASLIMMTAICPRSLNSRSIIFGPDDVVSIVVKDKKKLNERKVTTFDGEKFVDCQAGDRIVISQSDKVSKFIKTNNTSFLERIRDKM